MDLRTPYLGLELSSPLIAGASPLTERVDDVKRLEDAGAGAVVMPSLFEEQILLSRERLARDVDAPAESFPEALSYLPRVEHLRLRLGPEEYAEQVRRLKEAVSIPVVASLNGVTAGGWADAARRCEQAGADALELNVYYLPSDPAETGEAVERRTLDAVAAARAAVRVPLAVKLSPFVSSLPSFARRLAEAGAAGAVLFNRFYQPDIDIERLEAVPTLRPSDSSELLLRLRWLAILSGRVDLTLAAAGGVHTAADAVKAIMAGAQGVQLVSALLRGGPERLGAIRRELAEWMETHEYASVAQMSGSMSHRTCPDPSAFERANYVAALRGGV